MPLLPPPDAPTKETPHTPGQPATGWSTGFDWAADANRKERERMVGELDFMTKLTSIARDLVAVADKLDTVFGSVEANGYAWRYYLPPFPLPGTLAPLRIEDVGMGLPIAVWLHGLLHATTDFTVYVEGQPVVIPAKALEVIRRIAKAGG
jgi:hypothetical protein